MEQNLQPSIKPSPLHQQKAVYFVVAIIVILAVGGGVLISIKNFNTEQDVNSVQVPAECTSHGGNAMACSAARSGKKIATSTPVSQIDTTGWKTYTNGYFSVKYPANLIAGTQSVDPSSTNFVWFYHELKNTCPANSNCMSAIGQGVLSAQTLGSTISLDEAVKESALYTNDSAIAQNINIKIDDRDALEVIFCRTVCTSNNHLPATYFVINNGIAFQITFFAGEENTGQQILSTFKFTTSNSSAADTSGTPSPSLVEGWKTYTNSEFGFSFMYPTEWTPNNLSATQAVYFDPLQHPDMAATVKVEWHQTSQFYNYTDLNSYISLNFDGIISKMNKKINGNTWTVIDSKPSWATGAEVLDALIQRGSNIYHVYTQKIDPDVTLYNQILSTFQFTK